MVKTDRNVCNILVLDDEKTNIDIIKNAISADYNIYYALKPNDAFKILDRINIDLILLDVMMPEMDGYEVCRRLKSDTRTGGIPVIFISAKNEEIDEISGFNIGAVDYLSKPICPSILQARVKTHLALTAAMKELEKQNAVLAENVRLREDIEKITRHDLKAPLTAFVNIPEMLIRDKTLGSDHKDMLEILSKSANRMLEMINRSLDLCKMEQGTYKLISVPVNIVKIVHQVVYQCDRQIRLKKIKFSMLFNNKPVGDDDDVEFYGEEFLFFSMLSNLIKNAIEASPENGEVLVLLNDSPAPSICVRNRGAIPDAIRERIFQKYATFGKARGTGLGVYSARLMARTLGGDLTFETSEAEGTTFIVALGSAAMTYCPVKAAPEQLQIAEPGYLPPQMPKAETKILIVDDFGYMRVIIKEILKKEGYLKIFEAEDGEKAIEFLDKKHVDLVLCDWNMPGVSGLEVAEFVQGRENLRGIPFVMITANANYSEIEQAAAGGVRHYLAKPFSPDLLCKKVETALAKNNGSAIAGKS